MLILFLGGHWDGIRRDCPEPLHPRYEIPVPDESAGRDTFGAPLLYTRQLYTLEVLVDNGIRTFIYAYSDLKPGSRIAMFISRYRGHNFECPHCDRRIT